MTMHDNTGARWDWQTSLLVSSLLLSSIEEIPFWLLLWWIWSVSNVIHYASPIQRMLLPTVLYGNALISLSHSITTDIQTSLNNEQVCLYCRTVLQTMWNMSQWPICQWSIYIIFNDKPDNQPIHYKIMGFPMILVLIHCDLLLFQKFQLDSNKQEIHNCMITDIIISNHGFQTW
jgi:hypothetical protein